MENEDNRIVFTFDPGEPPQDAPEDIMSAEDAGLSEEIFTDIGVEPDGDAAADLDADTEPDEPADGSGGQEPPEESGDIPSKERRKKLLVTPMKMNMNTKYRRRRMVALAAICLIVLIPVISLISKAFGGKKPVTTENVGPLPSEEVEVHRVPVYYDYSSPVPESDADSAHFSNALLVGDTRLVQLLPTYNIGTFAKVLYGSAINVSNAMTYDSVDGDGNELTLSAALTERTYGKIYLCFGLNELGWSYPDVFASDYRELIDSVRALQPDASIYLLALVPVAESQYSNDYINNTRIKQYNEMILSIASDYRIYYVDCFTGMSDASGSLAADYTSNGFYINQTGANAWWAYLTTHTVNPEDYEN